ncbi:hypothetical protein SDJN02_12573, partial [Cucurbita argyrosperma subsp. argyrosperma]
MALVPLIISVVAFLPILHQPPAQPSSADATRNDSLTFICLYITAVITGLYLIIFNSTPSSKYGAQILLPEIWSTHDMIYSTFNIPPSSQSGRCTTKFRVRLKLLQEGAGGDFVMISAS